MSKIYRRPMFRGGGKVSSYGNGITAPLVPGYQGGGQIGGGIIQGQPMADGRYGFAKPVLYNAAEQVAQNSLFRSPGTEYLEREALKKQGQVPMIPIDVPGVEKLPSENLIESKPEKLNEPKVKATGYNTGLGESEIGINDQFGEGLEILSTEELYEKKIDTILKKIEEGKRLNPGEEKIRIENKIKDYNEINNLGETQKTKEEIITKPNEESKVVKTLGTDNEPTIEETEASLEIDPKDAIAQNQELFKELLGSKKARGQDISDMLLRFSGSQGNTLGEKFQNYTRAESAAGPGRSEKINQTAAALSINDYVAGKRSQEQIDKLMEVENFRSKLSTNKFKIDPTKDKWTDALDKTVLKYNGKEGKADSVGIIGETIKKYEPGKQVYREDNVNPKKLDKLKKDLEIGITIITLSNNTKMIIEKLSEGNFVDLTKKYPI